MPRRIFAKKTAQYQTREQGKSKVMRTANSNCWTSLLGNYCKPIYYERATPPPHLLIYYANAAQWHPKQTPQLLEGENT